MELLTKLFNRALLRNFKQFTLLTLIFSFSTNVFANDFTITIKEKGTGALVEEATVVIVENDTYQTTDKNGVVTFSDITLPITVKTLAQGYDSLTEVLQTVNDNMTLYIYPVTLEGEGLVVTAERIIEKSSKITLSKEELINSAGSMGDPLKAITALPGIVPVGEASSEVYMRGSSESENIIWINRAPVGYLYHFGGFQSVINPALVEDMNLFLAGFPVEYGDALGGAIDVKLRAPKNDGLHYRFDISLIDSSFLIEGPVSEDSKDSVFFAARRSYIDLILSPDNATNSEEDQVTVVPRFYDTQALYRHVLKKGYIDTFFFAASDKFEEDIRESAKSDPQFAGTFGSEDEFQTMGSTWQQSWNRYWDSTMTLSFAIDKSSLQVGQDDNGNPFFSKIESNEIFWQPEVHWRPRRDEVITYGFESFYARAPVDVFLSRLPREDDPNFDFTSQKKFRINTNLYIKAFAPYIKYRKQWTNKLAATLGMRYSSVSVTGGFDSQDFSPRASVEYAVSNDTLLTASWGRYIQTPDAAEIVDQFGNPELEITEAQHRVLGIQHRINPLYSIKTEIYHKPMKNLVVAIDENEPPDNYANAGTGNAYGIDLFLKREPRNRVTGWLALSWAKSSRTNELTKVKRDFSGDQPITLTAVWGQPFGGSWHRWEWSIKAQVHSGNPYTAVTGRHLEDPNDPDSRYIAEFGKLNGERLPTYYKVDLRIAKEILYNESKIKLYIDFQNVTFRNNVIEYDYGNEYEFIDNPKELTGIGFLPYFGMQYEF